MTTFRKLGVLFLLAVALFAQTAKFPGAVATDSDLKVAENNLITALRGGITAGDTLILVSDASRIRANMLLTIDKEIVAVTDVSGNRLTVIRGFNGTTAERHRNNEAIYGFWTAWHHNAVAAEIKAIEQALGPGLANVSSGLVVSAGQYAWSQTPGASLTGGIINSITLTPCPAGVSGTNADHRLWISGGTGTAEAVKIAGGTCTSGAETGTLMFTPANSHSGSWSISSSGLQEAVFAVPGATITVAGTHDVSGVVVPSTGTRISCLAGAVIKLRDGANQPTIYASAAKVSVTGCEINGNKANNASPGPSGNVGIVFASDDGTAADNYIHDHATAAIAVYGGDRNQIVRNRTTANARPVWIVGAAVGNQISNNNFVGDGDGIQLYDTGNTGTMTDNAIRGNYIAGTTSSTGSVLACIGVLFAPRTTVSENTINNCGARGVMIFNASNSMVNGNHIWSAGKVSTSLFGGSGIDTDDSERLVITGNHVTGSLGAGIVIVNTRYSTITGNYLSGNGTWCLSHDTDGGCSGIAVLWEEGEVTGDNIVSSNVIIQSIRYGIREDDYTATPDPTKFANNSYLNNYLYNNFEADLSLFCTNCAVAGNRIPSTYNGNEFAVQGIRVTGDDGAYIQNLSAAKVKLGTGPNGGNDNGVTVQYDETAKKATVDVTGPFQGPMPLDLNPSGGAVRVPSQKSTTGTRYVCIDTAGKLVSQATACSGT